MTALKSAPDSSMFLSSGGTAHGLPFESSVSGLLPPVVYSGSDAL